MAVEDLTFYKGGMPANFGNALVIVDECATQKTNPSGF